MKPATMLGALVGTIALTIGVLWALSGSAGDDTTALDTGDGSTVVAAAPAFDEPTEGDASAAPGEGATAATPAPATDPATATPTAPVSGGLTISDQPLKLRGMGALLIGMTVAEAEQALSTTIVVEPGYTDADTCRYAKVGGDPNSPGLMVLVENGDFAGGVISRIDINETGATLSGVRFGSTKAEVLATYGDLIVASPHKYDTSPGSEYLTYVPGDPADADYRLVMETHADLVVAIRSGLLPSVEWVEGCS